MMRSQRLVIVSVDGTGVVAEKHMVSMPNKTLLVRCTVARGGKKWKHISSDLTSAWLQNRRILDDNNRGIRIEPTFPLALVKFFF
jgi:hypothetical protein